MSGSVRIRSTKPYSWECIIKETILLFQIKDMKNLVIYILLDSKLRKHLSTSVIGILRFSGCPELAPRVSIERPVDSRFINALMSLQWPKTYLSLMAVFILRRLVIRDHLTQAYDHSLQTEGRPM